MDYYDKRPRAKEGGYGHYNIFQICPKDSLYSRIVSLMKETKYNGLFDVEFLKSIDGTLYFMEINFRVDGEVYKLSPGINLPAEWCRLVLLDNNELPDNLTTGKQLFSGISETQDFSENVLSGNMNFFRWIKQFFQADKYILINFRDPLPVFVKLWVIVKRYVYMLFHR